MTESKPPLSAPEKLNTYAKDLCRGLSVQVDAGILEEVISLFNAGVLVLFATQPRAEFDENATRLKVCQGIRVSFKGKERIIELEGQLALSKAELEKARAENAAMKEALGFYGEAGNWYEGYDEECRSICRSDLIEVSPGNNCGGKRAREALAKLQGAGEKV